MRSPEIRQLLHKNGILHTEISFKQSDRVSPSCDSGHCSLDVAGIARCRGVQGRASRGVHGHVACRVVGGRLAALWAKTVWKVSSRERRRLRHRLVMWGAAVRHDSGAPRDRATLLAAVGRVTVWIACVTTISSYNQLVITIINYNNYACKRGCLHHVVAEPGAMQPM